MILRQNLRHPVDRRKVLRHHPDKKALSGFTNDDNFFKCIQKGEIAEVTSDQACRCHGERNEFTHLLLIFTAHEVLTNPEKRHQFDSVDPAIDDSLPHTKEVDPSSFCDVYGPIFEREGRFSKKQPVPALGGMDATKQEVEGFYDFWYNFDSWRSFEAYDKEAPEGGDS